MPLNNSYKIYTPKDFDKELRKRLSKELIEVFNRKLKYLSENPQHPSLNTKVLIVSKHCLNRLKVDDVFEFRVNMGFRCIFYVIHSEKTIILAKIGNHDDIQRWFPR